MRTTLFILLSALSWNATLSFAQEGAENGFQSRQGNDSLHSEENIRTYTEYVKADNFQDAYLPWKAAFSDAPVSQASLYTDGTKILRALIVASTDSIQQRKYVDELMSVYDQRINYLDTLNTLTKEPTTKGALLGLKVHDYLSYSGKCIHINKVYQWSKEGIESEKEHTAYYALQEFMDISLRKLKADEAHKEQFIQDYLTAADLAETAYKKATEGKDKQRLKLAKDNIDTYLIYSGAASCENLQNIYGPKVEQNKTNLAYLKQVIHIMQLMRCTEEEVYFAATEAAYAIEPTAETAAGCARMHYKKGNIEKSISYFDQAIQLEEDACKKAQYAYKAAMILFGRKQLILAKDYAKKALSYNPNSGEAYILLARLYASSPNWNNEPALNQCTYFAVIDKLLCAKNVDPNLTEKANQLIRTFAAHTPKDEDLFFLGLKKGAAVTIGGWIGETTIIR